MRRGDHLPMVTAPYVHGNERWPWAVVCACKLSFKVGDTYPWLTPKGQQTRTIRTLADAKVAHRLHYLSDESNTTCDHTAHVLTDSGRLVCANQHCREPL